MQPITVACGAVTSRRKNITQSVSNHTRICSLAYPVCLGRTRSVVHHRTCCAPYCIRTFTALYTSRSSRAGPPRAPAHASPASSVRSPSTPPPHTPRQRHTTLHTLTHHATNTSATSSNLQILQGQCLCVFPALGPTVTAVSPSHPGWASLGWGVSLAAATRSSARWFDCLRHCHHCRCHL